MNIGQMCVEVRWPIKTTIKIKGKLSLTTTISSKLRCLVCEKPVGDRWLSFCSSVLSVCWLSLVEFGAFIVQKLVTNHFIGSRFFVEQQHTFYSHNVFEQVNFYEKIMSWYHWLFRPRQECHNLILFCPKSTLLTNFNKNSFFHQHSQSFNLLCKMTLKVLSFFKVKNWNF